MHIDGEVDHQQVNLSSLFLKQGHVVDGVGGGLLAEGAYSTSRAAASTKTRSPAGRARPRWPAAAWRWWICCSRRSRTAPSSGTRSTRRARPRSRAAVSTPSAAGSVPPHGRSTQRSHDGLRLRARRRHLRQRRRPGDQPGRDLRQFAPRPPGVSPHSYARGGGLDLAGPGGKIISYSSIVGNTASDGYTIIDLEGAASRSRWHSRHRPLLCRREHLVQAWRRHRLVWRAPVVGEQYRTWQRGERRASTPALAAST